MSDLVVEKEPTVMSDEAMAKPQGSTEELPDESPMVEKNFNVVAERSRS